MTDIQVVRCRACDSWHLGDEAAKAISAMASELSDLRAKLKVAEEALLNAMTGLIIAAGKPCGCEPGDTYDPEFICGYHQGARECEDALYIIRGEE